MASEVKQTELKAINHKSTENFNNIKFIFMNLINTSLHSKK